jgi:hypothetical protein
MPTPQAGSTATEAGGDTSSPNQYHLHDNGVRISYFPGGAGPLTADGPVTVVYQDSQRSLTFRAAQVGVVAVADFGTCVTVPIETTIDAETMTATLLIPTVVLSDGRPARIRTALIASVHIHPLTGIGNPQRDTYRVITLTGEASTGPLPL